VTRRVDKVAPENRQFARGVIAAEINYRRDRRWQIFSWSSTVLLAITGGTPVLVRKAELKLDLWLAVLFTVAVATFTINSVLWCTEQADTIADLKARLETLDREIGIESMRAIHLLTPLHFKGRWLLRIGHTTTLTLIGTVAVATIWWSYVHR
jgi:hypothetical protein